MVFYRSQQPPGTIIIDTLERHLYLIKDETHALRYGIGVGRDGFTWQGLLQISRKAEWPDWHPPPEMIERQPYLPRFMAGGPGNPLGARAMYLGNTVYRIHGTNAPETIGTAVSSGCFRLVNDDVIDLYDRCRSARTSSCGKTESRLVGQTEIRFVCRSVPTHGAAEFRDASYCRFAMPATDCAVWPNRIARSSAVRMPP